MKLIDKIKNIFGKCKYETIYVERIPAPQEAIVRERVIRLLKENNE